jgi:uncharacterized membrane protein YfcA
MEFLIGFAIAMLIGLMGVGGGVITAPVLTIFFGVPPAESVGTALIFTAVVKLTAAPIYLYRRQVDFRILGLLLAGGLPGVLAGSFALARVNRSHQNGPVLAVLGLTVVLTATLNLYRMLRTQKELPSHDRSRLLPWLALPIGAEVGFSSAGAGALGSIMLMAMTTMPTAQVVGTDVLFGLGLSLAGGGISLGLGNYVGSLVLKLSIGGILGAFAGANLLSVLPSRPLRVALSIWLVSLGGQLCWRAFAG